MHLLLSALVLYAPCSVSIAIHEGEAAPCSGVLFSESATRSALDCKNVKLPRALSNLRLVRRTCEIQMAALTAKAESAENLLRVAPRPPARWVLPAIATGAALIGVAFGFLIKEGTK